MSLYIQAVYLPPDTTVRYEVVPGVHPEADERHNRTAVVQIDFAVVAYVNKTSLSRVSL